MEGAVPNGGKNSTLDKRTKINGKCLQIVEMDLAVIVPFLFPENPFVAEKAQLGKAIDLAAVSLVAVVNVSPVV